MSREAMEEELRQFPLLETAYLKTEQIEFLQRVRTICETECPRYGTSWSCPPAVGTVDECRERSQKLPDCFVFSTIAEVEDITSMEQTLNTRMEHEEITRQVAAIFRRHYGRVIVLSTESCDQCSHCTYPDAPCRKPERMFPCVESYGILVTSLAQSGGMSFENGANVITWFSVILFDAEAEGREAYAEG